MKWAVTNQLSGPGLVVLLRSFIKMLPYVKFSEDKVIFFVILREKCENGATLSLTLILTLTSIAD